ERTPVAVVGAAVRVAQLTAREREVHPQLDERQHAAAKRRDATDRAAVQAVDTTEVRRRVLPAMRPGEVDEAAGGERRREPVARLLVEHLPARVADRGELAEQMVHRGTSLRLPIAREPSPAGAAGSTAAGCAAGAGAASGLGGSSRNSTVGTKKRQPVTAVEKSRMRSVVPGGFPTNMLVSIRSITSGRRA